MSAPVYVMPPLLTIHGRPAAPADEQTELLRQLVKLQQEQLSFLQAHHGNQEGQAKWRAFLSRWESEFPGIGAGCKQVLPVVERAFLSLLRDLTERIANDPDSLSNEFELSEFLDRYVMRLGQLANIISQLAPLADATQEKG